MRVSKTFAFTMVLTTIALLALPAVPLATPVLAVTAVTAVAPASGSSQGGTAVTITGTGFAAAPCTPADMTPVTTVVFDSLGAPAVATAVTVVSATIITATTAAHLPGAVNITVNQGAPANACAAASSVTSTALYTYVVPTSTSTPSPSVTPSPTPTATATVTRTATPTATVAPTPASGVNVTGTVVGVAPGFHLVPGAHVVLVNQETGAALGTHTSSTGAFSVSVPRGPYRLSVADADDDQTGCLPVAGTPCGHLIFSELLGVPSGGLARGTIVLSARTVPTIPRSWWSVRFPPCMRLQAVTPLFSATFLTSSSGPEVVTTSLNIVNAGSFRTVACIDYWATGVDGSTRALPDSRVCLDLNPGAMGIFAGFLPPEASLAEIYSIDLDGAPPGGCDQPSFLSGCIYGISELHGTVTIKAGFDQATPSPSPTPCTFVCTVTDQGGPTRAARAAANISTRDEFGDNSVNQAVVHPAVFRSSSSQGWNSRILSCLGETPNPQPIVFDFAPDDGTKEGHFLYVAGVNPHGCALVDLKNIGALPDGVYSVLVSSTGLLGPGPTPSLSIPYLVSQAVTYSGSPVSMAFGDGAMPITSPAPNSGGQLYGALMLSRLGNWESKIHVMNLGLTNPTRYTLAFYDERGSPLGTFDDVIGARSRRTLRLADFPFLPAVGFRGSAIIIPGPGGSLAATAMHANYQTRRAFSYNLVAQGSVTGPEASGMRPCRLDGVVTCLSASNFRRGTDNNGKPDGLNSMVRLFNPDIRGTGESASLRVRFFDAAGVEWVDSAQTLTLPPRSAVDILSFNVPSLPRGFVGHVYVTSSVVPVVGISGSFFVNPGCGPSKAPYDCSIGYDDFRTANLVNERGLSE